jgi:hypothetical protein
MLSCSTFFVDLLEIRGLGHAREPDRAPASSITSMALSGKHATGDVAADISTAAATASSVI